METFVSYHITAQCHSPEDSESQWRMHSRRDGFSRRAPFDSFYSYTEQPQHWSTVFADVILD